MPFWVIQTDRDAQRDLAEMARSLRAYGVPFVGCELTPFGDTINYLFDPPPSDAFVIPYGSTKLTALARQLCWEGLFYDPETLRVDAWVKNRDDMVNQQVEFLTVAAVERQFRDATHDGYFFIRPVEDLKAFTGVCVPVRELAHWSTSHHAGSAFGSGVHYAKEFTKDTLCAVSPAVEIKMEWRFWIVDGCVVSGSLYYSNRNLVRIRVGPGSVFDAARKLASKWLPHPVCVMDVALVGDEFKVLEFNTFNSSGFYADDICSIVTAVSDYAVKLQGGSQG